MRPRGAHESSLIRTAGRRRSAARSPRPSSTGRGTAARRPRRWQRRVSRTPPSAAHVLPHSGAAAQTASLPLAAERLKWWAGERQGRALWRAASHSHLPRTPATPVMSHDHASPATLPRQLAATSAQTAARDPESCQPRRHDRMQCRARRRTTRRRRRRRGRAWLKPEQGTVATTATQRTGAAARRCDEGAARVALAATRRARGSCPARSSHRLTPIVSDPGQPRSSRPAAAADPAGARSAPRSRHRAGGASQQGCRRLRAVTVPAAHAAPQRSHRAAARVARGPSPGWVRHRRRPRRAVDSTQRARGAAPRAPRAPGRCG